jgi:hypothetical protein
MTRSPHATRTILTPPRWPSIVWQFVWAWIVAPIILWQSRGIHDTHGWQRQTMACCIAGYVHAVRD